MIELPTEVPQNVYSCELVDKVLYVSNLPQCYEDIMADPKIYIYDANVKVDANDTPEQITSKCLRVHILDSLQDDDDANASAFWAEENPNLSN